MDSNLKREKELMDEKIAQKLTEAKETTLKDKKSKQFQKSQALYQDYLHTMGIKVLKVE